MNKMMVLVGTVVLATTGFGADLGSVTKDGFTVRFAECRKCPHRMRLDADAKGVILRCKDNLMSRGHRAVDQEIPSSPVIEC